VKTNPSPDPIEHLEHLLVELDLTTLSHQLRPILRQSENTKPSYSDFLRIALEIEEAARHERKIQRRLRWSRLGPTISLADFDFAARPQLSAAVVRELTNAQFIEEGRNVILVGRSSTGKTTVAKILGHAACQRGLSVTYATMNDMLASLHAAKADGTYRKVFRRLWTPALLVIDDAGFATLDRENTSELFRLVCARYRRSSIVVTNLPFKRWGEFMASPEQAVAIADRLIDGATILRFSGPPFRKPRDISGAPLDGE
jgi:DNA replication protein DnaC